LNYLSKLEISAVLQNAPERHRPWMVLAFHHGLRISEVLSLTPAHFQGNCLLAKRGKHSRATTQAVLSTLDPIFDEATQLKSLSAC